MFLLGYCMFLLLRVSVRIIFGLNSFYHFLQCTFRLQEFFTIFFSSVFTHIPNMGFAMSCIYDGPNCLSISFLIFDKKTSKRRRLFENCSIFGYRERKYSNMWNDGSRACGQKSLQNHSFFSCRVHNDLFSLRFHFCALLKLKLH